MNQQPGEMSTSHYASASLISLPHSSLKFSSWNILSFLLYYSFCGGGADDDYDSW